MSTDPSTPAPLLPTVCKDLAWARNIVAQMKEGHGRHVSSREFRGGLNEGSSSEPPRAVPLAEFNQRMDALRAHAEWYRAVPDRRIGTLDGCRVMNDPQLCEIGDLTRSIRPELFHLRFVEVVLPGATPLRVHWDEPPISTPTRTATFERVRYEFVTSTGLHHEIFWKRIS